MMSPAICHRRNILSLRDLTTEHLPMLRGMLEKSYDCIEQRFGVFDYFISHRNRFWKCFRFGVSRHQIRAFVHYHPTFYHFHVHFAHASVCHHGISAGKAHLLEEVIDNIENISESYYRDRSLVCFLPERHDLLQRIREGPAWLTFWLDVSLIRRYLLVCKQAIWKVDQSNKMSFFPF